MTDIYSAEHSLHCIYNDYISILITSSAGCDYLLIIKNEYEKKYNY